METDNNSTTTAEPEHRSTGEFVGDLKDKVHDIAEGQQRAAADRIGGIAHAADSAADELAKHVPLAADALHRVAQRLEAAASTLREKDLDEMLRNVGEFARTQPVAFFAGAAFTGFALSRFLRSSAEQR